VDASIHRENEARKGWEDDLEMLVLFFVSDIVALPKEFSDRCDIPRLRTPYK